MRKFKKNARLEIWWKDIVEVASWQSEEDAAAYPPVNAASLGYFLNFGDSDGIPVIRIAGSVTEDGERGVEVIPLGVIVKIEELE